jgi:hypothetical protein
MSAAQLLVNSTRAACAAAQGHQPGPRLVRAGCHRTHRPGSTESGVMRCHALTRVWWAANPQSRCCTAATRLLALCATPVACRACGDADSCAQWPQKPLRSQRGSGGAVPCRCRSHTPPLTPLDTPSAASAAREAGAIRRSASEWEKNALVEFSGRVCGDERVHKALDLLEVRWTTHTSPQLLVHTLTSTCTATRCAGPQPAAALPVAPVGQTRSLPADCRGENETTVAPRDSCACANLTSYAKCRM